MATEGLKKMLRQVEIKSDGDVFHEIFKSRPHHISAMSPTLVQNIELHDGEWGNVGSVIFVNYTHDGKDKVVKHEIISIDEEKRLVAYKTIEGDLRELYKTFIITVHVDTHGENNLVTWTFEYEKLKEDVEDPNTLMDFFIAMSKDIETHHLKVES
ncbi:kirola-like [Impatiens glandulifera]|uniref:kirola-like n=1 Tax=Impatiens glandulifera TaxID=253017 RepID=UPI001FB0F2DC|nr:kirola-like [Impatiens glandulifera]